MKQDPARIVLLAGACFLAGVGAIGWAVFGANGFSLDDSWIHQVVGRNLATFGTVGFTPGLASSGSTSVVWPWVIASNHFLLPGVSPVAFLFILNAVFLGLIAAALNAAASRDALAGVDVLALSALPLLCGNLVWLASTGMEHLFQVAAVFLSAHFLFAAPASDSRRRWLVSGALLGLAITIRPESVAFLPLFLIAAFFIRRRRSDLILFAAPCLLGIALALASNFLTSGSVLPVTMAGRKWLYFGELHVTSLFRARTFLSQTGEGLVRAVSDTSGIQEWAGLVWGVMALGVFRLVRLRALRSLFLVVLALANFVVYLLLLPAAGHGMRYLSFVLVFPMPLLALGLFELATLAVWPARNRPQVLPRANAACLALVASLGLITLVQWAAITQVGIEHIRNTHESMGRWIAAHLPPAARVAAFDIGAIGYFSARPVVDLGGLVDPAFVPYLFANKVPDYMKQKKVGWLVLPIVRSEPGPDGQRPCRDLMERLMLCDERVLGKRERISFFSPRQPWELGFRTTGHSFQGQVLYEISWP